MMDAKDVKYKSLINRDIVITDVVIMVNTKHWGEIERLKGKIKRNHMINIKLPTKNQIDGYIFKSSVN